MPQKIDALLDAITNNDNERIRNILYSINEYKKEWHKNKLISQYKINLDKLSSSGENLIMRAILLEQIDNVIMLMQYGANLNIMSEVNIEERLIKVNALDVALYIGNVDIFKFLLMYDPNTHIKNLDKSLFNLDKWTIGDRYSRNDSIKVKIQEQATHKIMKSNFSSFIYIIKAMTADNSIDATKNYLNAFVVDQCFTLECFEIIIEESNRLTNGIPFERTQLLKLDKKMYSFDTLKIFMNVLTLIFNNFYFLNEPHQLQTKFESILIDILALHQNLKYSENELLKSTFLFKTDEEARDFITSNIKDQDKKISIKTMNQNEKRKIQDISILSTCNKEIVKDDIIKRQKTEDEK